MQAGRSGQKARKPVRFADVRHLAFVVAEAVCDDVDGNVRKSAEEVLVVPIRLNRCRLWRNNSNHYLPMRNSIWLVHRN